MQRALMGKKKVDSLQEQMDSCKQRYGNSKKESKINTRNQKHCDVNKECL